MHYRELASYMYIHTVTFRALFISLTSQQQYYGLPMIENTCIEFIILLSYFLPLEVNTQ